MGPSCKGCVVQFRPCQGAKKGKQVASSAKWGLGNTFCAWLNA